MHTSYEQAVHLTGLTPEDCSTLFMPFPIKVLNHRQVDELIEPGSPFEPLQGMIGHYIHPYLRLPTRLKALLNLQRDPDQYTFDWLLFEIESNLKSAIMPDSVFQKAWLEQKHCLKSIREKLDFVLGDI